MAKRGKKKYRKVGFIGKGMKKSVGLSVSCLNGTKGMFPEGCSWNWVSYNRVGYLEVVNEEDEVLAQYKQDEVVAVTGEQTFFRDSFWK